MMVLMAKEEKKEHFEIQASVGLKQVKMIFGPKTSLNDALDQVAERVLKQAKTYPAILTISKK